MKKYILLSLIMLPSCKTPSQEKTDEAFIDLNSSTRIMIELIKTDKLSAVLEDPAESAGINRLIKNVSPASMAFEFEVLNQEKPSLVLFYQKDNSQTTNLSNVFARLAEKYPNLIFVIIDADELFSLTQQSYITELPTVLLIHNRKEIKRLEKEITFNTLHSLIDKLVLSKL